MPPQPHTQELVVISVMLAGIVLASLHATRGMKGACSGEYFLAGRNVGWLALGVSLAVTSLWGVWAVLAGASIRTDLMAWILPGGSVVAGLLLLGVVFAPAYRGSHASTFAGFLGERYGRGVGIAGGTVLLAVTLLVRIPFTIVVGSRLLQWLFGWEVMSSALLMIVIPGLFVIAGGYRAVVATQTAGGLTAAVGVLFLSSTHFSPGDASLQRLLPDLDASWVPLLSGLAILVLWVTCADQAVNQRSLAARSSGAIRSGSILAAGLVVLGLVALAAGFDPSSAESNGVSSGIVAGFIGAGIIGFGMASLSGLFMSAATISTLDLLLANRKSGDDAALVLVGRLANTVVVILAITAASSIALTGAESVRWMAHVAAISVPPLVSIALLGLLWPRMHGRGALWGMSLGWIAGIAYAGMGAEGIGPLMHEVLIGFASATAACIGVSLLSEPRAILESVATPLTQDRLEVREP